MSRFGNQLKLRHDMKHLHKIAFLPLFAALLLAACDRNRHTPDPDTEKVPLSFSALSHNIPVKAGESPLSESHQDFGVWGYATKQGQMDYLIWEERAMSRVKYSENSGSFIPDTYAFWLSGYDYNFIAIAPYNDGAKNLSDFSVATSRDALSFAYDMSDIYAPSTEGVAPRPGIDLMGSIAKAHVEKAVDKGVQDLRFHRLTSRIDIKIIFENSGNELSDIPEISGLRLENVDADAAYTISYPSENTLSYASENTLEINCNIGDNSKTTIPLSLTKSDDGWWRVTLYILPQDVSKSKFELYIDFNIGNDSYKDFPINLTFPADDREYGINQWHTWKITLTPSLFVFFEPSVTDWADGGQADDEIGFN